MISLSSMTMSAFILINFRQIAEDQHCSNPLNGHNRSQLWIRFLLDDSIGFFVDSFARSYGYNIDDLLRGYAINYPESADAVAL